MIILCATILLIKLSSSPLRASL